MRNAREKKRRFYRKVARTHKLNLNLWRLFERLYPEWNRAPHWADADWRTWWDQAHQACNEWINKITGECASHHHGMGSCPAWFRRDLNRLRRSREKAALRRAEIKADWDDFALPRFRRDANWLWW